MVAFVDEGNCMSDLHDFEKQLREFVPRMPDIPRDNVLYRAGYEAALADVARGGTAKAGSQGWRKQIYVAASIVVALISGVLAGKQWGENRSELPRQIIAAQTVKPPVRQVEQIEPTKPAEVVKPSETPNTKTSVTKSQTAVLSVWESFLPKIGLQSQELTLASNGGANYLDLRERVMKLGMHAMPNDSMLNSSPTIQLKTKVLTPLNFDLK
jgi:hypothetical protein